MKFEQISVFTAKLIPPWFCYLFPLISIYFSTHGKGLMAVGGGFIFGAGGMVFIAALAPNHSRLRFHAAQMLLFCIIYFALMLLVLAGAIMSLGESIRHAGPGAAPAGGMLAIYILGIVLGGGSLLFGVILIFLAVMTGKGRDIKLPGIGALAAKIASFQK
jgi:hypothetical protein